MILSNLFRRPSRPAPVRRARLSLEALDGRYTPSDTGYGDPPGGANPPIVIPNAPPQIVNFQAAEISPGLYHFTGKVIDEAPGGLTVTFGGGPPTTFGKTVVTAADGTFSLTISMEQDGSDAGIVTVQTKDNANQLSNVAQVYIAPTPDD